MHSVFVSLQSQKKIGMVTELLTVWLVGVVTFFVLWAVLAKVIKRISERKNNPEQTAEEESTEASVSDNQRSSHC